MDVLNRGGIVPSSGNLPPDTWDFFSFTQPCAVRDDQRQERVPRALSVYLRSRRFQNGRQRGVGLGGFVPVPGPKTHALHPHRSAPLAPGPRRRVRVVLSVDTHTPAPFWPHIRPIHRLCRPTSH